MNEPNWSNETFRVLLDAIPDGILVANREGKVLVANKQAAQLFGLRREQLLGKPVETLMPTRFRDQHVQQRDAFFEHPQLRLMDAGRDLVAVRSDGTDVPVDIALTPVTIDSETFVVSAIRDLGERLRLELNGSEAVRRASEQRFQRVADSVPVLIWMSDSDKLSTYFNKSWLDFTGRPFEQEKGHGWAEGVHPEDLSRCLDIYGQSFDQRVEFKMEYRLRRHDGEYRWVLDHGVPMFNQDGSFAGYIGCCIDVTERKLAEEALSTVSCRLIEAQEQERTRIARDLHDDINQQLALLAIEMEELKQSPPHGASEVATMMGELARRTREISMEIQSISHRLHSSKLEYVGIVAAMRSLCAELATQYKVEVDFKHGDFSASVPYELSLCLFRVLQEALHNAAEHSGAKLFKVELWSTEKEVHLRVTDSGVGFDLPGAMSRQGLGLISMQERIKGMNGTISISSKLGGGTTIHARVPLSAAGSSPQAAG